MRIQTLTLATAASTLFLLACAPADSSSELQQAVGNGNAYAVGQNRGCATRDLSDDEKTHVEDHLRANGYKGKPGGGGDGTTPPPLPPSVTGGIITTYVHVITDGGLDRASELAGLGIAMGLRPAMDHRFLGASSQA